MPEFTGERVVPGQVNPDLLNEHMARYLFAQRLARNKRVLDIACGTGYGTAELAHVAQHVVGIDVSPETVEAAKKTYAGANTTFQVADATKLPFPDGSFDLITAFEVIEHLEDWPALLSEARRLLAPDGQFIVSTPNKEYYAETRVESGPNPFHVREFTYEEFSCALEQNFTSVRFYLQNHVEALSFQPLSTANLKADLFVARTHIEPRDTHFFLAVCALTPQTGGPTFVYLPATTNVLREREQHIAKLKAELAQKDEWLDCLKNDHAELVRIHRETLEWGRGLEDSLSKSQVHIGTLDAEVARLGQIISSLQLSLEELHQGSMLLQADLQSRIEELQKAVDMLHETEALVEERTNWAMTSEARTRELEQILRLARASRWVRLGKRIGVGPALPE